MRFFTTIACLIALSASTSANGYGAALGGIYAPGHASLDYYSYPKYAFEYAVRDPHTGDNKAQWEKREGDVVTGAYSLVEPDGSIRVVEYRADDKSGFNAIVKRIGPNLHPVTPIYKAPIPVLGAKAIAPIAVGPVIGLKGLASAPLLNGNLYDGALSSAAILKTPIVKEIVPVIQPRINPIPIIKEALAPLPIIKEPLYPALPILRQPIYPGPLPILKQPIYPAPLPIIKEPIYSAPLPILKSPIYPGPGPIYKDLLLPQPLPILKSPIISAPIYKEAIVPNYPILKGPIEVPLLNKYAGLGGLDYNLLGKGIH